MPGMVKTIANGPEHIVRFVAFANGLGKETPEADAFVDQYRTSIYHRAIAAAVAHGKHKVAIRLHNEIKDQLKGTDATLLAKIAEAARQALVAEDYTKQFVPPSPETATVEDVAEAWRVATDQNNGDWKDDDAQRATNQHDIDVKFGKAKQEAAKFEAAAEDGVIQWLTTPIADGRPQTARPPLKLWVRLTPDQQRRELLARLLFRESTYDKSQKSDSGACGIAQLTPETLTAMGIDPTTFDCTDAKLSIETGAAYLARLYERYKSWPEAVGSYNFGPNGIGNYLKGDDYPFDKIPETTTNKTLRLWRRRWEEMKLFLRYIFRGNPDAFK